MDATLVFVLALVVLLAAVAVGFYVVKQRRSRSLRSRYGEEYLATMDDTGSRRKAEAELRAREKRVKSFSLRSLSDEEAEEFAFRWRRVQAEFVDDPGRAIEHADELLAQVMRGRGYPVGDFEQRAADLSVDYPRLVSDYRLAHDVAQMHARGGAGTEDLRRAMIAYRALFEDLLELQVAPRRPEERRAFSTEEPDDERAARVRREEYATRSDDRAVRERRVDGRDEGERAPRF